MKVKEDVTVYTCDHCKRKMFVKKAMELHEIACYQNPENKRACSFCIHLEETELTYEKSMNDMGPGGGVIFDAYSSTRKAKSFRCNFFNKILYPYKVQKLGLVEKYPETFEDQEPMPKECAEWKPIL